MGTHLPPTSVNFETLFAASPNAYVLLDRNLTIVWMNDAYLRATMRSREDILGRPMFEAFPSDPSSEGRRLLEGSLLRVVETGEKDEIALIRYDIESPDGVMDTRYWSATHTPLQDDAGAAAYVLQHTVDVTELHGLRALRDQVGIVDRASAVQARNLDLIAESENLKLLFAQTPGFLALLEGPDHVFTLANDAYLELIGNRDVIGRSVADALPEVVGQGFVGLLDDVRRKGEPYFGRAERVTLENAQSGPADEVFLDFIYQPILAEDGTVRGVLVQGHDVTDQVSAREQQDLLINELNHRVKNTLAVIQGLAAQSFRGVPEAEAARSKFDMRLHALAAAHSLLTERNWQAAGLRETMRKSIEAAAGSDIERVTLTGPEVVLAPQAAISMAMLIHELSTNALKYGALAVPEGRVAIDWTTEEDGVGTQLTVRWTECEGPRVVAPKRRGFGTRLIERGISSGLGGKVELEFAEQGLRCKVSVTLPASS